MSTSIFSSVRVEPCFYTGNVVHKAPYNAVDSLPEKCREIFIKSKIEGKKQKDIAAELNISLKTVENQMDIAYKKIKSELKDYLPLLIFLLAN